MTAAPESGAPPAAEDDLPPLTAADSDLLEPARSSGEATPANRALRFLVAMPDRLVFAFLAAAIPVGIAGVFRVFHPAVVLPAIVLAVVAFWRWTPSTFAAADVTGQRARAFRQAALGAGIALAVVALWVWINRAYVSQYVVLQRDPAIYTLRAMWLTEHSTPVIDVSAEGAAIAGVPGATFDALAFPSIGTTVYPQSNGLLPALLAVAGWVGGTAAIIQGNLVVAGVALVAVYGFARRLMGPLWALVPLVTLAVSMPMTAFSRAPYSEPIALMATFAGLTLLWTAWRSGRPSRFLAAGLLVGVASLARIDGGATLIGVLAGFAVVTLGARSIQVRRRAALNATAYFVGNAVLLAISLVDGLRNSPIYLRSESGNLVPLTVATVVAWIAVVAAAFLPMAGLRAKLAEHRAAAGRVVALAAAVVGLVMISRPLWWTSRVMPDDPGNTAVKGMQANYGQPSDPTRRYDESSINWLAMYVGTLTVVLGAVGAAMLLSRIVRRRDGRIAPFVMMVACVSALYLNRISIFPDQVWAMRRFLPVVLPGLLIAAVYPLTRLTVRRTRLAMLAIPAAAVVVLGSLTPWSSTVWSAANMGGQVQEMNIGCAAVGNRPVVLAGPNPGSAWFLPTFKIGCGVPTVSLPEATPQALATIAAQFGGEVAVVAFDPAKVPWAGPVPEPVNGGTFTSWEQPLQRVPEALRTTTRTMWVGLIGPDGRVVPAG